MFLFSFLPWYFQIQGMQDNSGLIFLHISHHFMPFIHNPECLFSGFNFGYQHRYSNQLWLCHSLVQFCSLFGFLRFLLSLAYLSNSFNDGHNFHVSLTPFRAGAHFNPDRSMITCLFPTTNSTVNTRSNQARGKVRTKEKMVYA